MEQKTAQGICFGNMKFILHRTTLELPLQLTSVHLVVIINVLEKSCVMINDEEPGQCGISRSRIWSKWLLVYNVGTLPMEK